MKRKELKDFKTKELKDLKNKVDSLRLSISKTKAELVSSKEKNLKKVKNLRRDLSQVLTLVREKEISEIEERKEEK